LFNEYLLRRLGDPPLNVVILADRRCVDETLAAIPPERLDLVGPVNRRWLLRPFQLGTGRFHPKSYLVVATPVMARSWPDYSPNHPVAISQNGMEKQMSRTSHTPGHMRDTHIWQWLYCTSN
jgi:hypothetical protein